MSTKSVHCPECRSQSIGERNVAYAELRVLDWELNEDENLVVGTMDYDMGVEVEWETEDCVGPYVCRACAWRGDLSDLTIREPVAIGVVAEVRIKDWLEMADGGQRSDDAIVKITDAKGEVIASTNAGFLKALLARVQGNGGAE